MKTVTPLLILLSLYLFIDSCSKEKTGRYTENITCNETDDSLNTYNLKIGTLLSANCANAGCHDAITHEQGRDYSNYTQAKNDFDALALCTIYYDQNCQPMPRNAARLSYDNIHDLCCWVKNGYPQ